MKSNPSPRELAAEALQALREAPMTPHEHFEFLIQQGIIDRTGRVLVAKSSNAEPSKATEGITETPASLPPIAGK